MSEIDEKITALTAAWYAYVGLDHHKDWDCHFYIEKVWSYGKPPIYRVSHPGYRTDFVSPEFRTAVEAHEWLYRVLRRELEWALNWAKQTAADEDDFWNKREADAAIPILEAALAL